MHMHCDNNNDNINLCIINNWFAEFYYFLIILCVSNGLKTTYRELYRYCIVLEFIPKNSIQWEQLNFNFDQSDNLKFLKRECENYLPKLFSKNFKTYPFFFQLAKLFPLFEKSSFLKNYTFCVKFCLSTFWKQWFWSRRHYKLK